MKMKSVVDIIVFGATGFTGKYIAEECAKRGSFTWAVAGRSATKLNELLQKLTLKTGITLDGIPILEADCSNEESMKEMARMGKVVVNCTGPYRFYGEAVVKACVESGTSYIDISGEPEFMEQMQLLYFDSAQKNHCYVVSSCGMDSVPVDLGVVHFSKNFDGQVNYVEAYLQQASNSDKFETMVNYTTWESAVHGFSNIASLMKVRKQLFSKSKRMKPEPTMPERGTVHRSEICENKHSIPFPGSDRSVVVRSQSFLFNECGNRPVQCKVYLVCDSFPILVGILIIGYFLQLLTKYEWGKKLLLNYPQIFSFGLMSHQGPSEETQESSIATFKFYGKGWTKEVLSKHPVPTTITEATNAEMMTMVEIRNPAYGFTSICAIECALLILQEPDKLPSKGGVYTPGYAFYNTSILDRLAKRGAEFKIINKRQI